MSVHIKVGFTVSRVSGKSTFLTSHTNIHNILLRCFFICFYIYDAMVGPGSNLVLHLSYHAKMAISNRDCQTPNLHLKSQRSFSEPLNRAFSSSKISTSIYNSLSIHQQKMRRDWPQPEPLARSQSPLSQAGEWSTREKTFRWRNCVPR